MLADIGGQENVNVNKTPSFPKRLKPTMLNRDERIHCRISAPSILFTNKSFAQREDFDEADFMLSDGSIIFLTTSIYADRDGTSYGGKIIPDIIEDFDYKKINSETDPVIKRALDWIHGNK